MNIIYLCIILVAIAFGIGFYFKHVSAKKEKNIQKFECHSCGEKDCECQLIEK